MMLKGETGREDKRKGKKKKKRRKVEKKDLVQFIMARRCDGGAIGAFLSGVWCALHWIAIYFVAISV